LLHVNGHSTFTFGISQYKPFFLLGLIHAQPFFRLLFVVNLKEGLSLQQIPHEIGQLVLTSALLQFASRRTGVDLTHLHDLFLLPSIRKSLTLTQLIVGAIVGVYGDGAFVLLGVKDGAGGDILIGLFEGTKVGADGGSVTQLSHVDGHPTFISDLSQYKSFLFFFCLSHAQSFVCPLFVVNLKEGLSLQQIPHEIGQLVLTSALLQFASRRTRVDLTHSHDLLSLLSIRKSLTLTQLIVGAVVGINADRAIDDAILSTATLLFTTRKEQITKKVFLIPFTYTISFQRFYWKCKQLYCSCLSSL